MKAFIVISLIALLSLSVSAVGGPSYIDRMCHNGGFDYGIEKFAWNGDSWILFSDDHPEWDIGVDGDTMNVYWKSSPEVYGVLGYENGEYHVHAGGNSGHLEKQDNGIHYVIFCGNEPEVPEFGIIGAALASVAVMGFIFSRKH